MLSPIPPALVTCGEGENANILTIAWTGILSSTPPKTYISVRPSRHSYSILKEKREFVIHLCSEELVHAADYCGTFTGAKVNKFEKCGLATVQSSEVACPTLEAAPVALECRVTDVIPLGSHDMFVADIVAVTCREDLLDEQGKIHFEKARLIAYSHGEYYTLGKKVGTFGFSAVKPKRRKRASKPKPPKSDSQ